MSAADDEIRATYEGLLVDTVVEELDQLRAELADARKRIELDRGRLDSLGQKLKARGIEVDRLKSENERLREAADVGFDLASALRTDVSDPKVRVAIALLVAQDETKGSDK